MELPSSSTASQLRTIVVGVDGSEASFDALRFAIQQARVNGAKVRAVRAWQLPPEAFGGWIPKVPDLDLYQSRALAALEQNLEDAELTDAGVTVTPLVRNGQPADILCQESRDADMLVVGSRGLGGFKGLLLGSVSQQCAHYALCPVVIIPDRSRGLS